MQYETEMVPLLLVVYLLVPLLPLPPPPPQQPPDPKGVGSLARSGIRQVNYVTTYPLSLPPPLIPSSPYPPLPLPLLFLPRGILLQIYIDNLCANKPVSAECPFSLLLSDSNILNKC
jgi:hypothetical protein